MAFTAPRTWTDGELVTKAIMDPHIRDNFLAMPPHLISRKTADQTVTSSTALVDCTSMVLPVGTSETWQFEFDVLYTASTAGDLKLGFTIPASSRLDASAMWMSSVPSAGIQSITGTSSPTSSTTFQGLGTGADRLLLPLKGIYVGGGTAGNVTLQFAQQVSDGTATTIFTNSTVWAVKLA